MHVYLPQIKGFEHQGHHQLDGPSSWRSSVFRQSKLLPFLSHFYCNRCWVLVFSFPGELCTKQQQQKKWKAIKRSSHNMSAGRPSSPGFNAFIRQMTSVWNTFMVECVSEKTKSCGKMKRCLKGCVCKMVTDE